jgi:hypothetical protein
MSTISIKLFLILLSLWLILNAIISWSLYYLGFLALQSHAISVFLSLTQ